MKIIHRIWGEVQIVQAFSSHINIMTKQGIKAAHETELQYIAEQGEGNTINLTGTVPLPILPVQDMPVDPLVPINLLTPDQLYKKFKQLGKLNCRRIVERASQQPFADVEDMVNRLSDLFDDANIIRTIGDRMSFTVPNSDLSTTETASTIPVEVLQTATPVIA